jgi:hypothetical protein
MNKDNTSFTQKAWVEYKKIGYVLCPAFDNEPVYFDRHGFRHILRKGRKKRSYNEQVKRLYLVKEAVEILKTSETFSEWNVSFLIKPIACFWIKVLVRQFERSRKHFFSVFD